MGGGFEAKGFCGKFNLGIGYTERCINIGAWAFSAFTY
jgi:hypothetical protein